MRGFYLKPSTDASVEFAMVGMGLRVGRLQDIYAGFSWRDASGPAAVRKAVRIPARARKVV